MDKQTVKPVKVVVSCAQTGDEPEVCRCEVCRNRRYVATLNYFASLVQHGEELM